MKLTQTAYVILGLLSIEPNQSGYEMRKTIQGSVGYFWGESFGQIYPALKRMTAEGLIVATSSTTGRKRSQEYSITEAGLACLREWLPVPFQPSPPRDEFLLKLFFGKVAAPEVSIRHIREFQDRNRRLLATLLETEAIGRAKNASHPHFPFWMLTLTYGVAEIRAALEWSESALAMLAALEAEASKSPLPSQDNRSTNQP